MFKLYIIRTSKKAKLMNILRTMMNNNSFFELTHSLIDVEVAGNWKSGSVSQSFVNKVPSNEAFVIIYTGSIQSVLSLS